MSAEQRICRAEDCDQPAAPGKQFCCDQCRFAHHRQNTLLAYYANHEVNKARQREYVRHNKEKIKLNRKRYNQKLKRLSTKKLFSGIEYTKPTGADFAAWEKDDRDNGKPIVGLKLASLPTIKFERIVQELLGR